MLTSSFDDREIEILVVALRFWRSQRRDGHTRRTDPPFTQERVDLLLAKLGFGIVSPLPPDSDDLPTNLFSR
jgi:hypothetical protein